MFFLWPWATLTRVPFVTWRLCARELRAIEKWPLLLSYQFSTSFLLSPSALDSALCLVSLALGWAGDGTNYGIGRAFLAKFTLWVQEIRIHGFLYVTYGAIRHLDSSFGFSMDIWKLYVNSHPPSGVWSLPVSSLGDMATKEMVIQGETKRRKISYFIQWENKGKMDFFLHFAILSPLDSPQNLVPWVPKFW